MSETKEDDQRRVWWREWVKKALVGRADSALVGGSLQRKYLVKLGLSDDRIFHGYNVVDNEYFHAGASAARAESATLRSELGLPPEYFFACTRFLPRKNVDGLLRAYSEYVSGRGQNAWGLVVAGSGAEEGRLRNLVGELGLTGVVWPGFVQYGRLPAFYGLASAFIHPAEQEAWGLVVNEAAASELPLLLSQTVGARYELLEEGVNGYSFDPSDSSALSALMVQVSGQKLLSRTAMGARSMEIVSRWSPRRFGEQMLAAIAAGRAAASR